MFFKPKWYRLMPAHLRPSAAAATELEGIRKTYNFPHESFFYRILSSAETTKRVQYNVYHKLKNERPHATEDLILRTVLSSRCQTPPGYPPGHLWSEKELDEAMKRIDSIDALCNYIDELESKEPEIGFDTFGVGPKIDEILRSDSKKSNT
jgi:hypothetical protein